MPVEGEALELDDKAEGRTEDSQLLVGAYLAATVGALVLVGGV